MKILLVFFFISSIVNISALTVDPLSSPEKPVKAIETITVKTHYGNLHLEKTCEGNKSVVKVSTDIKLNQEVRSEAFSRDIKKDEITLILKRNSQCEITHFTVSKPAKLNALNQLGKQFCAELILDSEWQSLIKDACGNTCLPIIIPVIINL